MSAIRSAAARRSHSRSSQSPYARPAPKKSSWNISNFLGFLNPFRSRSSNDTAPESDPVSDVEDDSSTSVVAESLSKRGHQMARDLRMNGAGNAGPSFQQTELRWPQLLDKSTPAAEEATRFRFSSTPSTPDRGTSPVGTSNIFSYHAGTQSAQISAPSPRKTLSRNPNGTYRWQGGGSAKAPRSRNRYSSPAFGPSRTASDRVILKESQSNEPPKADTKRRRIGQEASASSSASSGSNIKGRNGNVLTPPPDPLPLTAKPTEALPFPVSNTSSSTLRANGSLLSKPDRPSTSSLLRISQKPTAPVIPSPLRQTWSGSSPTQGDPATPPQQKQTKAANFMAELIKEVTPPKRPDLSNPYQTANPLGKVATLPKPRISKKRVRATGKPTLPEVKVEKPKEQETVVAEKKENETEKVYSPQAIIEATVPKGSKRSRPPTHSEKASDIDASSSAGRLPEDTLKAPVPVVEEIEEDADEAKRTKKKSKPFLSGQGLASVAQKKPLFVSQDIIIEEIPAPEAPSEKPKSVTSPPTQFMPFNTGPSTTGPSTLTGRPSFSGFKSASIPKEPSKLRYSYQPEPSNPITPTPTPALAPIPSSTQTPPAESKTKLIGAKEAALAIPAESLQTFVFSVSTNFPLLSNSEYGKARDKAKSLSKSLLPHFEFTIQTIQPQPDTKSSTAPVKGFDWAAAGREPISKGGSEASWTCSTCMLSNPSTAIDKCTICDAPR